jgi:preprotein translocase subunit SecF
MQLFGKPTKFDFMAQRKLTMIISSVLIVLSLGSFMVRGLAYGIDFTGGTLIELGFSEQADLSSIRSTLSDEGFDDAVVQHFGTTRDVLIRIGLREDLEQADISTVAIDAIKAASALESEVRRVEFVGPRVGEELREQGGLAMLIALGAILIYVMLRFEIRFAVGSVAALVHDVLITVGIFSILGLQFDLTVLAAVLAVIGYSLNDTIVVFDRIRENFRKMRKGSSVDVVNTSLNQTLARTLMTSITTLIVLLILFSLGGEIIHGFATALTIGVLIGTYSSIYVASSTILALNVTKQDLMPVKKEGAEFDTTP